MNCAQCVRLLDARLDDELDAATAAELDNHMEHCAECQTLRAERLALAAALQRAREARGVPVALEQRIRAAIAGNAAPVGRKGPGWPLAIAMAVAAAALAWIVTLTLVRPESPRPDLLHAIVDRHVAALAAGGPQSVPLQVTSTERHEVKPWFQGRAPLSPPVPDLAPEGFELLGGRVERIGERAVAVVAYRIRKHPVELYAWVDAGPDAPMREQSSRGFSTVQWRADSLSFTAISDGSAGDLQRFARLVEERRR
jgi:anti-sigma factor RsiW